MSRQPEDLAETRRWEAEMNRVTRAGFLMWDWKEQPNLRRLAEIITELTGTKVYITRLDTGMDQYGVVVSAKPLDAVKAASVFREWLHTDGYPDVIDLPPGASHDAT